MHILVFQLHAKICFVNKTVFFHFTFLISLNNKAAKMWEVNTLEAFSQHQKKEQ